MTATGLADLATAILTHACPNGGIEEDGWKSFYIETHCVAWRVSAKRIDGVWTIRSATAEDC